METGLPTGSIMKYNFLLTLLFLVKIDVIISNIMQTIPVATMQELVKEVTLKNHSNNGFAILHRLSP